MKLIRCSLLLLGLALCVSPARAFTPQTIVIDGVNDFNPANLLNDDRGDTEIKNWCVDDAENDSTMDLGRVYVTNDANFLYIGYEYFEDCFGDVQLGLAIDVNNTVAGGTTDPFTRKVGWTTITNRPDAYVYLEQNANNYEIFYRWNGSAWADSTVLINPAGAGSNALGASDHTRFVEFRIPRTALRTITGQTLNLELWMTQNGSQKGPLDAMCSDNVQMSRATGTTFDTTAVVEMTCMLPYVVLAAVDNTPPTVSTANAVNFALQANRQFLTTTNKVDLLFSEPVDVTSAQTALNYTYSGPVTRNVSTAVRDVSTPSLVHLTLNGTISANAAFHNITVLNVKDEANNTIVANGTTNVGSFFIQNLAFEGDFRLRLCKGEFAPSDTFAIEGDLTPLTFSVADNAYMYDANTDSVYTVTVPISLVKDAGTGKAEGNLNWKFSHKQSPDPYEPGSNRFYHLSSDSGATRTLRASWGDDVPGNFTSHKIDVIFKVDTRRLLRVTAPHKFWLTGNQLPLTFNRPGVLMKDDGVSPDAAANDSIYTLKVRFPPCAATNVNWKVVYDSTATDTVFECPGQGDRDVFLNSALFDTTGGSLGPITLPARGLNRCTVTDKPVAVFFDVFMEPVSPAPGPADTVAVIGNRPPLSSDRPPSAAGRLFDNGVPPDVTAGDKRFARSVIFPDSTGFTVNYKFWYNRNATNFGFECEGGGDRSFQLDDVSHSASVPIVRPVAQFNNCTTLDVPIVPGPADAVADFAVLKQSFPNPFARSTTIAFDLKRAGHVTLRVYDITGRIVATLVDGSLAAGPRQVVWNARNPSGQRVRTGVYLYELALGGERLSRRVVVTQ